MSDLTALNAARRASDLTALGDIGRVDVVVIGGGITGTGIALDAASRGLSVVLVEKHDLAFGTSRWSSKLVHGGLRYLASGNVGIARRSAVERGILMTRNAPHLVHAMPQLVPLLPSMSRAQRALVRTGFVAGDALRMLAGTRSSMLPRSRRISVQQAVEMAPTVRRDGLDGALLAYDGQLIDDARLVAAVARTAAQHGARILTRVSASSAAGRSVELTDELTGESLELAGPGGDQRDGGVGRRGGPVHQAAAQPRHASGVRRRHVRQSGCGTDHPDTRGDQPLRVRHARAAGPGLSGADRRGRARADSRCAGTDTGREVSFLLDTVNTALGTALTTADVTGAYAGLRPLIDAGEGQRPSDLSRDHAVLESDSGVFSVVGGKLTEYRHMAEDMLDRALAARAVTARPCRTRNLPLVGAPANPVATLRTPAALPGSLVARYGAESPNVIASARCERPTEPVVDGIDVTRAEFEFAVTHEGALTVDDILDRRTRIGLVAADRERAVTAAQEFLAATS